MSRYDDPRDDGRMTVRQRPKGFDDLTPAQQRAAFAFAKKYGQEVEGVSEHLDTFFRLATAN